MSEDDQKQLEKLKRNLELEKNNPQKDDDYVAYLQQQVNVFENKVKQSKG